MTKYSIVVADDESLTRDRIVALLANYRNFNVVSEASNGLETVNAVRLHKPDILFLDIKMPLLNGFEVLEELSKEDYKLVVFITAYDDYAIKAFENEAIDYLLKPFNDRRFDILIGRIEQYMVRFYEEPILIIKEHNDVYRVKTKDIIYIKAENNYVCIVLDRTSYRMRISLKEILNKLDNSFIKIHRSYLINKSQIKRMKHIKSGDYLFLMTNKKSIISSQSYREWVKLLTR